MLWWFDDSKRTDAQKIRDGCARYMERYDVAPNVALVSVGVDAAVEGVEVRPLARIRPNNYQIGIEEAR